METASASPRTRHTRQAMPHGPAGVAPLPALRPDPPRPARYRAAMGSPFISDVPAAQAVAAWRDACAADGCPARVETVRVSVGEAVGPPAARDRPCALLDGTRQHPLRALHLCT